MNLDETLVEPGVENAVILYSYILQAADSSLLSSGIVTSDLALS